MPSPELDSAAPAFASFDRPRNTLSLSDHRSIQAVAVDYWLCVEDRQIWGPSMLPPPALRPALVAHGIARAGGFRQVPHSEPAVRIADAENGGDPHSWLWLSRLYLQAGLTNEAGHMLEKFLGAHHPCEESLVVRGLLRTARSEAPFETGELARTWKSPAAEFTAAMLFLRHAYASGSLGELNRTLSRVQKITDSLRATNPSAAQTATIRIQRYIWESSNDSRSAITSLGKFSDSLPLDTFEQLTPNQFLELESVRRFADRVTIIALHRGEESVARFAADLALRLDPACARAHLLYSVTHRKEATAARRHMTSAAALGVLERRYAHRSTVSDGTFDRYHDFKELPIFPSSTIVPRSEPEPDALLEARYRPFLEIEPPRAEAPILCHAPLMLYNYLGTAEVAYYSSVTLQRAMVLGFREDLHSAIKGRHSPDGASAGIAVWRKSPHPRCREISEKWANVGNLPAADQAKLIKLVTALGFFTEARHAVESLSYGDPPASPDGFYLHVLRHYVRNLTDRPGSSRPFGTALLQTVDKASSDPRLLRMLLNLSIYGMVQFARRNDVPGVELWRNRGQAYLARYTGRAEVSAFESHLMTSRYWRAATFLPYLTGDHDALLREFQLVLDHAGAAEPGSADEAILKQENMIPAFESASRTHQALGRFDEALDFMKRASSVDPLDSKILMQVGDLYQRRSDLETALRYFERAAEIAVPHGPVLWFRAGRVRQLMGDGDGAVNCYLRSIELEPDGISNYRNIMSITAERSDSYLHTWASSVLSELGAKAGHAG